MNLQTFFKSIENIEYTLIEQTDTYVIINITQINWYTVRFIAYSIKWKVDQYATTLEEAKQWVNYTNSKSAINTQDIYNSKVIHETSELPNWLEEKVGLSYCDLEDVTQDKIVICTHVDKCLGSSNWIEILSVRFSGYPIMIVVRGITEKSGTDIEILITDSEGYRLMVNYLYQFKIDRILNQKQYNTPKDISIMWGYFTEDLLKETS